jgi:glycosyltransferase involved in cell wall biosynthesis
MLSICIGHFDRLEYLRKCIQSLNQVDLSIPVDLIICDFIKHNDPSIVDHQKVIANLVISNSQFPVKVVYKSGPFSCGLGRNVAAKCSQGNILYFCDVDYADTSGFD